jgi:hypothetical protein
MAPVRLISRAGPAPSAWQEQQPYRISQNLTFQMEP